MANFVVYDAAGGVDALNNFFQAHPIRITTTTTSVTYQNTDGTWVVLTGTGMAFDGNGVPTGGTITGATWYDSTQSVPLAAFSNEAVALSDLYGVWVASYQSPYSLFLTGNDTVIGNDYDDNNLPGGPGNDSLSGGAGNDYFDPGNGSDTVDGGTGGYDEISYSAKNSDPSITQGISVDLGSGSLIDPWGNTDVFSNIEDIRSTRFADTLIGTDGINFFTPLAGDDSIDGGAGQDRIRYDRDSNYGGIAGVTVDLAAGTATDGFGDHDSFTSIEAVKGTSQGDLLHGGDAPLPIGNAYELYGDNGNDTLTAGAFQAYIQPGAGNDSIVGGASTIDIVSYQEYTGANAAVFNFATGIINDPYGGTDTVTGVEEARGTPNNDSFVGDGANNQFFGLGGNDTIDGAAGFDRVRYDRDSQFGGNAGVTVNLETGIATDGFGDTDTLISIEQITGTNQADNLTGGDSNLGGSNTYEIFALAGNDTITAGTFQLYVEPGAGDDSIIGGSGRDQISYAEYTGTNGAVFNFGNGTVNDPYGGTDHFTGVEGARGTANADDFIGGAGNEFFRGLAGNDTFNGGGGDDEVRYDKDAQYGGMAGVTVNLGLGTATDGFGDTDTLIGIDRARGTGQADTLTGGAENDTLTGGLGDDVLDGGGGSNTAVFAGLAASYTVSNTGGTVSVAGADGSDTLTHIQLLQFDDQTIAAPSAAGPSSFSVAATDAAKLEGNDPNNSTPFIFTITRSGDLSQTQTVSGAIAGSGANAANAADFADSQLGGTLTFAPGDTTQTVTVDVHGDSVLEPDETFTLTLTGTTGGATIATATATGTILNDDASFAIAATDASKSEGNSGATPFTFTVTRSGYTGAAGTLRWAVIGLNPNSANAVDFTGGAPPSGTLSFAAGQVSQTITVGVQGDTIAEADEHFAVTLAAPSPGGSIATATANATILNDDTNLAISPTAFSHLEGNSGATPFVYTVTRSGLLTGASTVRWSVVGALPNSAGAGDFGGGVAPSGTLSFAAGVTTQTITVNVQGDTAVEPDENFSVLLSAATGASITTGSTLATILNDDTSYAIAATDASKAEGNTGATPFTFTVTRAGLLTGAGTVGWSVIGLLPNSANPADFVGGAPPSGTVSFAAGQTSQTITVNVRGDTTVEADDGFRVVLSHASGGAAIVVAGANAAILNDDTGLAIAATSANKAEGNAGATPFTFTVTRSGLLTGSNSVTWSVIGAAPNSAGASDFVGAAAPSGTVSFAAGQTTQTITVNVQGDTVVEPNENFIVMLTNATGGASILANKAQATILNDDTNQASYAIAATDASKAEGNAGSTPFIFTVTRSGFIAGAGTIGWSVTGLAPNSANPADFVAGVVPSGTLSFAAGQATQTITVNIQGDTTVEANEGFRVVLAHASGSDSITTSSADASIINDDPSGPPAALAASTTQIATADFDGDGTADLLRQAANGTLYVLNGATGVQNPVSLSAASLAFLAATDLNGDGRADLLLQNPSTGGLYDWTMNGATVQHADLITTLTPGTSFAQAASFHDGSAEILLQNPGSASWTLLHVNGPTILASNEDGARPTL